MTTTTPRCVVTDAYDRPCIHRQGHVVSHMFETEITLRFRLFAGNGKILERTFESREAADRFEARNAIVVVERIES